MSLKEGLRKYGRAWGKIYREVGGRKTATQCKQFFDDFCRDEELDLHQALMEHSSLKVGTKSVAVASMLTFSEAHACTMMVA